MTTTTSTSTVATKSPVFAIPLTTEQHDMVKAAAKSQNVTAAHFGRALILAAAAAAMGVDVPVVEHAKRGPKGGSRHPLAIKFNLTTAEAKKRLNYHLDAFVASGSKGKFDVNKLDLSVDPFVKVEDVAEAVETPAVDSTETLATETV